MDALAVSKSWPVENATVAYIENNGEVTSFGNLEHVYPLASVTKLLTSYAVLIALEEGVFELDTPAGVASVKHLLSHTAGYDFGSDAVLAPVADRRIYSNTGFEILAHALEEHSSITFSEYLQEAVFQPLGMVNSSLPGTAAAGGTSTVADLTKFAAELLNPTLVSPSLFADATQPVFPGLPGVLPGFGRQADNAWGLGFEIKAGKSPHWTGTQNSPRTFGHFGQSGTFLWCDPQLQAAAVALTDRPFGSWAVEAWPAFSDGVISEVLSS